MDNLNPKGDDKIICFCMGVTQGEIVDAIKNGATSVEQISDETGASTVCGTCRGRIEALIEEYK